MLKLKEMAKDKEGKFICPHCQRPILSLSREFIEFDQWKWNPRSKKYEKQPTDSREQCLCDCCRKAISPAACEFLAGQDET